MRRKRDRILIIAAMCGIASLMVAVPIGVVAFLNTRSISKIEHVDARTNREQSFRICSRAMADRAEQHFRAQLTAPVTLKALLLKLGLPGSLAAKINLSAVERRLPIVDCSPNLRGERAIPLSVAEQQLFVKLYLRDSATPPVCDRRVYDLAIKRERRASAACNQHAFDMVPR